MSDYDRDSRQICKFGGKCYQKNPKHHAKFKHPPAPIKAKIAEAGDAAHASAEMLMKKRKSEDDTLTEDSSNKKAKVIDTLNNNKKNLSPHKSRSPSPHISPVKSPQPAAAISSPNKNVEISSDTNKVAEPSNFAADEKELPDDPPTLKESIKQKFLVDMPEDFYKFYSFCKELKPSDPLGAMSSCGIQLVGAFDVVAGKKLTPRTPSRFLCHWRYYYDPPELQTVLSLGGKGRHMGYFRDSPDQPPVFLASMSDEKPGIVKPMGGNIFDAVREFLKESGKTADPFKKVTITKLIENLEEAAEDYGYKLDTIAEIVKQRRKNVVCRTFHGAGLVVPFDKTTEVGYREIPETDASLRRMLAKVADAKTPEARTTHFTDIQELVTNAQWATDEGDFGMGLELGLALFLHGCPHLHTAAHHLMTVAYDLLHRDAFSAILKAHLKNRRKGDQLSAFD